MKFTSKLLNAVGLSKLALKNEVAARQLQLLDSSQIATSVQRDTVNKGASKTNSFMRRWRALIGSPNSDLNESERKTLIARSRDSYRNDPIGRAAITRPRTHVVGMGLTLKASVDHKTLNITEEEAQELNDFIERKFRAWAKNPLECDKRAMLNFYQQQSVAYCSSKVSGDCFALTPTIEREHCEFTTKIQLVETDRVSNPNGKQNSETLQDGIQFDANGVQQFIHINKSHPGDLSATRKGHDTIRVYGKKTGRRRVMHVFNDIERPDQIRSAPFLAPILEPLRKIEDYSSNEIAAAAIQSLLTVFIEHEVGTESSDPDAHPISSDAELDEGAAPDEIKLGEASVLDLEEGAKAKLVAPTRPYSNYGPFLEDVAKQLGAAIGIPFEEVMLYYSSSYSAARAAMLQAWETYLTDRSWFVATFCQPTYECWFDDAVALGIIPVIGYFDPARRAAYTNALWIGPKQGSIDELKEARAQAQYLKNNTTNQEIEAIKTSGMDFDEVLAGAARSHEKLKKAGLFTTEKETAVFNENSEEEDKENLDEDEAA